MRPIFFQSSSSSSPPTPSPSFSTNPTTGGYHARLQRLASLLCVPERRHGQYSPYVRRPACSPYLTVRFPCPSRVGLKLLLLAPAERFFSMSKQAAATHLQLYEQFTRECMEIDELMDLCRVSVVGLRESALRAPRRLRTGCASLPFSSSGSFFLLPCHTRVPLAELPAPGRPRCPGLVVCAHVYPAGDAKLCGKLRQLQRHAWHKRGPHGGDAGAVQPCAGARSEPPPGRE